MCYTCTYSLCRGCIRKADYVCVRGDKGFCTICMKMITLIENNGQGEDGKVYKFLYPRFFYILRILEDVFIRTLIYAVFCYGLVF